MRDLLKWFKPKPCPGCEARRETIEHQEKLIQQLLDRLDVPSLEVNMDLKEDFVKDEKEEVRTGDKPQPEFAPEIFDE